MGKSLDELANELRNSDKKVQLIYAFNGVGKTRLSHAFKDLASPKQEEETNLIKVVYYNAFTEDLFYWDNDLDEDRNRRLKIHPNGFTRWVLVDEGKEDRIVSLFQHYTNNKLSPRFNEHYSEVAFSIGSGNDEPIKNIKISRGEESCFIWSVFYSLIEEIIATLNIPDSEDRTTSKFDSLEYIFIDDPVSSLDENHLIELAVNISELIKSSTSSVKFIITTHNPLFYNVLYNELNNSTPDYKPRMAKKQRLERLEDGTFNLLDQSNDSPFSYHLFLLSQLEKAVQSGNVQKYHFNFLRNVLEKTATFLGHSRWVDILPDEGARGAYYSRIVNLSSHARVSSEESYLLGDNDKRVLSYLVKKIKEKIGFNITEVK